MKRVKSLHNRAIEIAELAFKLKREGKIDMSIKKFYKAFELEKEAAGLIQIDKKNEPSRSILYRSAGSLALNANLFIEAEKMVAHGLLGFPPKEIADELRDLFDQINFERHLNLKGIKLSNNEQSEKAGSSVTLIGILDFAQSKKNEIAITDRNKKEHIIKVSEGRLAAIVKSNFEDEVKITGTIEIKRKKEIIVLTDLERVIE